MALSARVTATIKPTFWFVFCYINAANVIFELGSPAARSLNNLNYYCPNETVKALPKLRAVGLDIGPQLVLDCIIRALKSVRLHSSSSSRFEF